MDFKYIFLLILSITVACGNSIIDSDLIEENPNYIDSNSKINQNIDNADSLHSLYTNDILLDLTPKTWEGGYWTLNDSSKVVLSLQWRYISYFILKGEPIIMVGYNLNLTNNSYRDIIMSLKRFTLQDKDDIQIAEYTPLQTVTISINAQQKQDFGGEFSVNIPISVANTATKLNVYSIFEFKTSSIIQK